MHDLREHNELHVEHIESLLNEAGICTKNPLELLHFDQQHSIWSGTLKLMDKLNSLKFLHATNYQQMYMAI